MAKSLPYLLSEVSDLAKCQTKEDLEKYLRSFLKGHHQVKISPGLTPADVLLLVLPEFDRDTLGFLRSALLQFIRELKHQRWLEYWAPNAIEEVLTVAPSIFEGDSKSQAVVELHEIVSQPHWYSQHSSRVGNFGSPIHLLLLHALLELGFRPVDPEFWTNIVHKVEGLNRDGSYSQEDLEAYMATAWQGLWKRDVDFAITWLAGAEATPARVAAVARQMPLMWEEADRGQRAYWCLRDRIAELPIEYREHIQGFASAKERSLPGNPREAAYRGLGMYESTLAKRGVILEEPEW